MFGYRTVMPLEVYILNKEKSDFEYEFLQQADNADRQKFYNEACVSIVANSAIVETYHIDKGLMSFIPEHIAMLFFKDLMTCPEYDRPTSVIDANRKESIIGSILRTNKEDDKWGMTKNKIIDKALMASYIERNKALM
jgi:hypothetical protein